MNKRQSSSKINAETKSLYVHEYKVTPIFIKVIPQSLINMNISICLAILFFLVDYPFSCFLL